jgi:hypothetical protein
MAEAEPSRRIRFGIDGISRQTHSHVPMSMRSTTMVRGQIAELRDGRPFSAAVTDSPLLPAKQRRRTSCWALAGDPIRVRPNVAREMSSLPRRGPRPTRSASARSRRRKKTMAELEVTGRGSLNSLSFGHPEMHDATANPPPMTTPSLVGLVLSVILLRVTKNGSRPVARH